VKLKRLDSRDNHNRDYFPVFPIKTLRQEGLFDENSDSLAATAADVGRTKNRVKLRAVDKENSKTLTIDALAAAGQSPVQRVVDIHRPILLPIPALG
jgi:hypothetical protein